MLALTACAPMDVEDAVSGTVTSPLLSGAVSWVNGTYTGCTDRSGSWSARVSGTAPMTSAALSVVKNDPTCVLTLTGVMADQLYAATPAIVLGTSYAAIPSSLGSGAAQFLGNAKLDTAGFSNDFEISFVYGSAGGDATPTVAASAGPTGYASVQSAAAALAVPAPSYTIDVSNLRFQSDLLQLIVGLTGQAVLTDGAFTGASYVIDTGTLPASSPSYAQVAAAYAGAILTQKTISGANPTIPASEFGVLTLSLLGSTQVRNVIVKRSSGGVASYQVFKVTFIS